MNIKEVIASLYKHIRYTDPMNCSVVHRYDLISYAAFIEEAKELLEDVANPNKMSETQDTLVARYNHLREKARTLLEKWK